MNNMYQSLNEQQFSQMLYQDMSLQIKSKQLLPRNFFKEFIEKNLYTDQFQVFHEYPHLQYPHLAQEYLSLIDFPVCLSEVMEKLRANPNGIQYDSIGDLIQHLCLISYNCRKFNPPDNELISICQQFEDQIVQMVNEYIKKSDSKLQPFKEYQALQKMVFKAWPPGKVPIMIQQNRRRPRSPYREEVDLLIYRFSKLNMVRQSQLISSLIQELYYDSEQNIKINNTGNVQGTSLKIDFSQLKPQTFQWFSNIVLEMFQQEFGIQDELKQEQEMQKLIKQYKQPNQDFAYVNINKEYELAALNNQHVHGPELTTVKTEQATSLNSQQQSYENSKESTEPNK